jgi:hypothetical protein
MESMPANGRDAGGDANHLQVGAEHESFLVDALHPLLYQQFFNLVIQAESILANPFNSKILTFMNNRFGYHQSPVLPQELDYGIMPCRGNLHNTFVNDGASENTFGKTPLLPHH